MNDEKCTKCNKPRCGDGCIPKAVPALHLTGWCHGHEPSCKGCGGSGLVGKHPLNPLKIIDPCPSCTPQESEGIDEEWEHAKWIHEFLHDVAPAGIESVSGGDAVFTCQFNKFAIWRENLISQTRTEEARRLRSALQKQMVDGDKCELVGLAAAITILDKACEEGK